MIYSLASVLLFFTVGIPKLETFPRIYLYLGSLLFVAYEICLSLSLGFAHNHSQSIEVGMVNYLWPSMTILMAVIFKQQKANLLLIPGMLLSFIGLCWVLSGDRGLSLAGDFYQRAKQSAELWTGLCWSHYLGTLLHADQQESQWQQRHYAVLYAYRANFVD